MKSVIKLRICMIIIFSIVFVGCVTPGKKLPDFLPIEIQDTPGDTHIVATALLARLNSVQPIFDAHISFGKEAADQLDNSPFSYRNFTIMGQRLYQYTKRPDGKSGRLVAGQMILGDYLGRQAKLNYFAEYSIADSEFVIEKATVYPSYAINPRVESFLVPVDTFNKEQSKYPRTWKGLYHLANRLNVLSVIDDKSCRESKEYILFTFCMNQTAPSAKAVLRLANKKSPDLDYGYAKSSKYMIFDGWLVSTTTGSFPAKSEKEFWVKLILSPGKESESSRSRIVFHQELGEIVIN